MGRSQGYARYEDYCDHHGVTSFSTATALCTQCAPVSFSPQREGVNEARVTARAAGLKTFKSVCTVHGDAQHWVTNGKCATCANSGGKPRPTMLKRPGPRVRNPARAAARARGAKTYESECATHGEGPYWVRTSKCKACSHESGLPRTRPLR